MIRNETHTINRDERGQTALETAIILISFIVVATVFAFTILAAGSSSTEKSEEAVMSGLEGVQGSMMMRGDVMAIDDDGAGGVTGHVTNLRFRVALVTGDEPVNLDPATGDISIQYTDAAQIDDTSAIGNLTYTLRVVTGDADNLLEEGEMFEIDLDVNGLVTPLDVSTAFNVEVLSSEGGTALTIEKTTPPVIDPVMNLN